MGKIKDLTGHTYGRLYVESFHGLKNNKSAYWNCLCICGTQILVKGAHLISGAIVSCKCHRIDLTIKHGDCFTGEITREYRCWQAMKDRCLNKNQKHYKHYGGRGIKVCKSWMKYSNFLSDMGRSTDDCPTIDRIDNNGNYEKSNCRWASMKTQRNNTSKTVRVTHNGITKSITEWSNMYSIPTTTARHRLSKGIPFDDVFRKVPFKKGELKYIENVKL